MRIFADDCTRDWIIRLRNQSLCHIPTLYYLGGIIGNKASQIGERPPASPVFVLKFICVRNFGIAKAATGKFKEAEEALSSIQNEKYRSVGYFGLMLTNS